MIHIPPLITDLGFILVIAALATLLFKKLGQPLVLGYLIAGFLVGPHVPFMPTVTDKASIQVWSEIGVIFLLFSLGLEFSFKKLFKVGGSASFTAVFEVVFMLGLGYLLGRLLGWNSIDSLFLGGILSISSTTIIVRAFEELGLRKQKFVDLVFGILVVEDIVAIMLLVLLAAIGGTAVVSGWELAFSGVRLLFFIALWFVIGIFLIPIFLRKIRSLLEDETTLLVAIGLCFMMVMIAANVGFSPALGAFVMGSLLAETPEGHKMENLLRPVKNLFAAIFFVSVGMMIDPKVLVDRWDLVFLVTAVTISGKFFSTFLGALLSGQPRKQSVQAGLSLAQIGEFSFIIASLGVTMKVTSDFLYPLAIAVSAVTTFTTPYLIKISGPLFLWVEPRIPVGIKSRLDRYQASFERSDRGQGAGALLLKAYGMKILLNTVVVIAILGFFKGLIYGELKTYLQESPWSASISLLLCLTASAPFLWGVVLGGPSLKAQREADELQKLSGLQLGLFVGRVVLGLGLLGAILSQFVTLKIASGLIVLIVAAAALFGQFWVGRVYRFIETNFQKNLTEKERKDLLDLGVARKFLPWETSLSTYDISSESSLCGKALRVLPFKQNGITVAAVFRGPRRYFAPDGEFVVWPQDQLICFGSEEDLLSFHKKLEEEKSKAQELLEAEARRAGQEDFKLSSYVIGEASKFREKSIRESGIREHFRGMVVGIERGAERILGPAGNVLLKQDDLLWIVSDQKKEN